MVSQISLSLSYFMMEVIGRLWEHCVSNIPCKSTAYHAEIVTVWSFDAGYEWPLTLKFMYVCWWTPTHVSISLYEKTGYRVATIAWIHYPFTCRNQIWISLLWFVYSYVFLNTSVVRFCCIDAVLLWILINHDSYWTSQTVRWHNFGAKILY